ncbi:MAG: hypothetical protein CL581_08900 [Alteromonadaceae bacterium]|uniref:hypothetical protein n=1 Tax=Marinobacter sp. BGYM27 TaxID=2975597 RepID=UPI000C3571A4|nr:hypothetical protein [Marinobacter sp. BGYM27]MAA64879.1 hypothetical protein [Alteromonadaceae bacterium]MBH87142.1 hypothetical protein [Alteromonadaceae bacterium]MDG5501398.1 hypothetical protein [Marinobacter sp. BGYM27]|tara:strand:+ start:1717 stop:2274 length:558 start_codon:yes stop_codon:yes gene_type:complete
MKKTFQGLVAAAALAPTFAAAEGLSYNYLEGGLALYPNFDSQDYLGVVGRGSFALDEHFFAFGGLKYLEDDIDLTAMHIGGGYRHGLDAKTDVWGGVTAEYQEYDHNHHHGDVDDTALGLRGGLRHQLNEKLELGASARVITGDLDYVGLTGTGRYAIQENVKLFAEADLYDSELGLLGGVTVEF